MSSEEKTYYEHVQEIAAQLDAIYDRVGWLRDAADWNEKQIYNDTRGILSPLVGRWREFRNQLPKDRADMRF